MPSRPTPAPRSRFAVGVALAVAALVAGPAPAAHAAGTTFFVSPNGADSNSGTSARAPFRTIQRALDLARPGTTITLAAGSYREAVTTKVAGTAAEPITIRGPESGTGVGGRYRAVLYSPAGRVVSINHSYYTLDGFTIDGQPDIARSEYPTTLAQVRAFKDSVQTRAINSKLVYVGAADNVADLTGITISNMFLNGAGGECVRFRNRTTNSLVVASTIQWCGMLGQGDGVSDYRYHNGEGVYIGTSPKSTSQPYAANDTTNGIVVRDSVIHTFGSECFDVKENAHHNRLENTDCGFNDEPRSFQGSNIELRGHHNLVLTSTVSQSRSWNVKLASDAPSYDLGGNSIQRSSFSAAAAPAIRDDQSTAGSVFCDNAFASTPISEGSSSVGDPTQPCPDTTAPTAPTGLTAQAASPTSVTLRWAAATDDVGVTSYTVFRNGAPVATTAALTVTDSGLTASTAYTYTVVAGDAAGNASPASAPASVTTPAIPPGTQPIVVEAESGAVTSPMAVRTDRAAQGGRYVAQTSGTSIGRDTMTVTVPSAGRYALALRVIAPDSASDSFTYAVDGGAASVWNLGTRTSWTWLTGPTLTLTAGRHTVVVAKRENGARLDAIRLTPAA